MDIQYLYQYSNYGLTDDQNSTSLSLFGAGSLVSNFILLPILLKYISIYDVLKVGLTFQLTGYILLSLSSGSFMYPYFASILNGFSVISYTALTSICSLNTNQQGLMQGALESISDLADTLGSLCFGMIYPNLSSPQYIFVIASGIILLAIIASFFLKLSINSDESEVRLSISESLVNFELLNSDDNTINN